MTKIIRLSFLTLCLMFILMLPAMASDFVKPEYKQVYAQQTTDAELMATNGTFGVNNNLRWSLVNGTLTISGTGSMGENFAIGNTIYYPWPYLQVYNVLIQYGVTNIAGCAFYGCTNLKNIIIPGSVTHIGEYAFCDCTNLQSVSIPYSVLEMGEAVFFSCANLKSVTISAGLTEIPDGSFTNCISLRNIFIPSTVKRIGKLAFQNCSNLTSATFQYGIQVIGEGAFANCGLLTINIPSSVFTIDNGAFTECQSLKSVSLNGSSLTVNELAFSRCPTLSSIILLSGVREIKHAAFWQCYNLSNIKIETGLNSIGKSAFMETALTSITIPSSVTNIESGAFYHCESLSDIYYNGTRKQWFSIMEDVIDAYYPTGLEISTIVHYMAEPLVIQHISPEFSGNTISVQVYTDNQSGAVMTGLPVIAVYENGKLLDCSIGAKTTFEQGIDSYGAVLVCSAGYNRENIMLKAFVLQENTFTPLTGILIW